MHRVVRRRRSAPLRRCDNLGYGAATALDMRDTAALCEGCTIHVADGDPAGFDIPFGGTFTKKRGHGSHHRNRVLGTMLPRARDNVREGPARFNKRPVYLAFGKKQGAAGITTAAPYIAG
jgi:hypothetical protein